METSSPATPVPTKLPNPSGGLTAFRIGRASLLVAAVLIVPGTSILHAQTPNTVNLAPNSCPVVHDGDIVTFTFTPQFDIPSAVVGLRNIELRFSLEGRPDPASAPEAEFTLYAMPRRGEYEATGASMTAGPGGSIQFRFRANLRSTARGTFYLVAITGAPFLSRGYEGETPKIVNAPLRERLCLQVTPPY